MKNEKKYVKFALVREMMETPGIIRNFKSTNANDVSEQIKQTGKLFFTGEGSGRIFPAKNAIAQARKAGLDITLETEGAY
ncbi:MAG: sugar isomerase, partial [Planctomycetota bacterium]